MRDRLQAARTRHFPFALVGAAKPYIGDDIPRAAVLFNHLSTALHGERALLDKLLSVMNGAGIQRKIKFERLPLKIKHGDQHNKPRSGGSLLRVRIHAPPVNSV